jgi:hypothetical protein
LGCLRRWDHIDFGNRLALDGAGNSLITGRTTSIDLAGANNTYHGGPDDVFVAKISPAGTRIWATYLGVRGDPFQKVGRSK